VEENDVTERRRRRSHGIDAALEAKKSVAECIVTRLDGKIKEL
jgi:hypothetical protein